MLEFDKPSTPIKTIDDAVRYLAQRDGMLEFRRSKNEKSLLIKAVLYEDGHNIENALMISIAAEQQSRFDLFDETVARCVEAVRIADEPDWYGVS